MNELSVKQTVKAFIETNQNTLLSGLIGSGGQRYIEHITTTSLTPPTGYFFVAVDAESSEIREDAPNTINVQISGIKIAEYNITITLIDYITPVFGEDQLYETADGIFKTFCDRLANLVFDQLFFQSSDGTHKYTIPDPKVVNKVNTPVTWEEAEEYHAVLFCEITFILEECIVS